MEKFTIAIGQIKPRLGDLKWNMEHHLEVAEEASSKGASMILFPELSLTGYSIRDLNSELALSPEDSYFSPLRDISKKISVAVGSVTIDESYAIRNSLLYFEDGILKHIHHKVYLPTYGMFEEQRYFLPGKNVEVFDTKFGKLGMLICEDLWHISLPYLLAVQGAKLIVGSAASPTKLSGKAHPDDVEMHSGYNVNSEQHKSFARLLSLYLAFANRVGFEDGVNFWGGSEVVSPHGEVLTRGNLIEEQTIYAEVDMNEVRRARLFARHFLDEDPKLVLNHLNKLGY
ncbi:MAG: nitrilase-related carbon-nitrogen hydrolase [Candidatus Kryptoniota bacterium]